MNIETQNPHKLQDIALQSLEEYRADLKEEDRQERKKTKTKTKSKKVRGTFFASLRSKCSGAKTFFRILAAHTLGREQIRKIDKAWVGGAHA